MESTWQRYEAKYLVDEATAQRVRRFCLQNLRLDRFCEAHPERAYPIHSIYLDSPDFALARSVVARQTDRFKLRVRAYCDHHPHNGEHPFFFEIKRKLNGIIHKTRVKTAAGAAREALWQNAFPCGFGEDGANRESEALSKFMFLRQRVGAVPMLSVCYKRQAFESEVGQRVRISFDHDLRYGLIDRVRGGTREGIWPVRLRGVIVEVKFTNTYPAWVEGLLRGTELVRRGVCKYLICAQAAFGLFQPLEERRVV